jgi:hypothetical protein
MRPLQPSACNVLRRSRADRRPCRPVVPGSRARMAELQQFQGLDPQGAWRPSVAVSSSSFLRSHGCLPAASSCEWHRARS